MYSDLKKIFLRLRGGLRPTLSGKEDDILVFRHWGVVVLALSLLTLFILGFGFYVFYQISYGGSLSDMGSGAGNVETLSREKLNVVLQQFGEKATEFNVLKEKRPVAPSL
jgi:hypothetical protein